MQGLAVSRNVHYVAPGSKDGRYPPAHRAAIITEVYSLESYPPPMPMPDNPEGTYTVDQDGMITEVGLAVFNPTGIHFRQAVPFDPTGQIPGTWHWPEKV